MSTTSLLNQKPLPTYDTLVVSTGVSCLSHRPMRGLRGLFQHWILKRSRTTQSYENFACFFAGQGIPEPILHETYRVLANSLVLCPAFPVDPLDSLRAVYDLDCYSGNTLTELMNAIQRTSTMRFYKPVPAFLPCETVADLVFLLAARCDALYPSLSSEFLPNHHADSSISEAF